MADPVETSIGTVTPAHFQPRTVRHQVVVGPKFLYALFNPADRMHTVSRAFMTYIRDGELPYRRLVVNEHIVDEAATRLKKQATMDTATAFLTTLADSHLYQLESVSEDTFDAARERFIEWTDHGGSFTDFLVASQMAALEIDYIATYDSHYEAFDVTTIPYRSHQ